MSSLYVFLWACFRMAPKQLARHKMRSFLTMLGILIGVGGVMTIVSLGEGLRGFFMDVMATQASADLVYIMPDVPMEPGRVAQLGGRVVARRADGTDVVVTLRPIGLSLTSVLIEVGRGDKQASIRISQELERRVKR
ncbi:MAG: ABC transporter permease [candidate division NC10 bacterium]|nr:ABC transporter permease [candidate division NC10 bacterium]